MTPVLLGLLMIAGFTAQGFSQDITSYKDITVDALDSLLSSDEVILLDVRTPEEISAGKIGDAIEANVLSADFKIRLRGLDKDIQYVVYCRSGRRSVKASRTMQEEGFLQVYNLVGGYEAWIRKLRSGTRRRP